MHSEPELTSVSQMDAAAAGQTGSALRVSSFGLTDPGRVRERNEDQFVIAEIRRVLRIRQSSLPQPTALMGEGLGHLFVVADGMGGHQAGEYASALAVASVENMLLNSIGWLFCLKGEGILTEFQEAMRAADRWVLETAQGQPQLKGMGTTLTMAYVTDDVLYIAHAGDSRCYLYRDGRLQRLTRDHTLVESMVREGVLAPEAAARHSLRNVVTNAVGGDKRGVEPEVHKHRLADGDQLLLCSDGLSEMLTDDEIAGQLKAGGRTPEATCRRLVDEANARGGSDNITAVIAAFDWSRDGGGDAERTRQVGRV